MLHFCYDKEQNPQHGLKGAASPVPHLNLINPVFNTAPCSLPSSCISLPQVPFLTLNCLALCLPLCTLCFEPFFIQFSSVAQSCLILCDPMNRSTPGLPVHHQIPEFTQTHDHPVSDAIQPSHPLSSPSPPAPNPSQHRSLFQ